MGAEDGWEPSLLLVHPAPSPTQQTPIVLGCSGTSQEATSTQARAWKPPPELYQATTTTLSKPTAQPVLQVGGREGQDAEQGIQAFQLHLHRRVPALAGLDFPGQALLYGQAPRQQGHRIPHLPPVCCVCV